MDEGLQGARHQVVVMVEEALVAVVFALEQVLVVAAGVELPSERRRLRHVVLRGSDTRHGRLVRKTQDRRSAAD